MDRASDPEKRGPSPPSEDTQRASKRKRSRFGCNTCRSRKVKCDERRNGCGNCERLRLACSYTKPATTSRTHTGRRTYRSCNACRVARCKCSGDRPSCARCINNEIRCSYEDVSAPSKDSASSQPDMTDRSAMQVTPDRSSDAGSSMRQASLPVSSHGQSDTSLPWLTSRELPDQKHIQVLVNSYFQNFHTLRCFGFIHKPSFLRKLDDELGADTKKNALLHIMCTLGAQFYALEYGDTVQSLGTEFILKAGCHWAKTAERLLLSDTHKITVEGLMTAQLLYDYALRMANFTQAFIFSSLMARMTQALQINLEYSADLLNTSSETGLSVTSREGRRRLMWSCYITDVLCSSGVDQLALVHEKDLKIQLPCSEWSFLHERPCITRSLNGSPLPFVPPELVPPNIDDNTGLLGYFVQQIEIRRRVLQWHKRLKHMKAPWLRDSEFAQLDRELQAWYESLPPNLDFTASTIYMRKESSQLGALCVFHCAYHQTMCDLYRIATPELYKLRFPFDFPPETTQLKRSLQFALFKEARTLAAIIAEAERHGPSMIGDTWLPTIAYDSNRIMLFYLTQITESTGTSKRDLILSTLPYLQSNLKALKTMRATNVVADGLSRAAESMLSKLGVDSNNVLPLPNVILDDPYLALFSRNQQSVPGTPPQSAPDYQLNPLSIFRMARNEIPEGHAPESTITHANLVVNPTSANIYPSTEDMPPGLDQQQQEMYNSVEDFGHNLDMFFTPDQALDWQPAEMIVGSGMDSDGLMSWIGTSQMGDFMFESPGT